MIEIYISIRVSLPTLPAVRPLFIYLFYPPCFHGNPSHSGEPLSMWYLSHKPRNYTLLDGRCKHQGSPKLKRAIWPRKTTTTTATTTRSWESLWISYMLGHCMWLCVIVSWLIFLLSFTQETSEMPCPLKEDLKIIRLHTLWTFAHLFFSQLNAALWSCHADLSVLPQITSWPGSLLATPLVPVGAADTGSPAEQLQIAASGQTRDHLGRGLGGWRSVPSAPQRWGDRGLRRDQWGKRHPETGSHAPGARWDQLQRSHPSWDSARSSHLGHLLEGHLRSGAVSGFREGLTD